MGQLFQYQAFAEPIVSTTEEVTVDKWYVQGQPPVRRPASIPAGYSTAPLDPAQFPVAEVPFDWMRDQTVVARRLLPVQQTQSVGPVEPIVSVPFDWMREPNMPVYQPRRSQPTEASRPTEPPALIAMDWLGNAEVPMRRIVDLRTGWYSKPTAAPEPLPVIEWLRDQTVVMRPLGRAAPGQGLRWHEPVAPPAEVIPPECPYRPKRPDSSQPRRQRPDECERD